MFEFLRALGAAIEEKNGRGRRNDVEDRNDGVLREVGLLASNEGEECCPEKRDPKGLYKKARAGQIPEFTGISAPYEAPLKAELTIKNTKQSAEESLAEMISYLERQGYLSA